MTARGWCIYGEIFSSKQCNNHLVCSILSTFSKEMDKVDQLGEQVMVLNENTGETTMNSEQLNELERQLNEFKLGLERKEQQMMEHERNLQAQFAQQKLEYEAAMNNKNLEFETQVKKKEMYLRDLESKNTPRPIDDPMIIDKQIQELKDLGARPKISYKMREFKPGKRTLMNS
eukprot:NODE_837_length_3597_cov_0.278445.p3 type:complete len:174 gc:universal NODE_837_length_3597_cov_0.278445:1429-1950(+)